MEPDFIKLKEIKPVLSGYLRKAESLAKATGFPDEKGVHDVRVLMKKARAVLRLTAPQLDIEFTEREIKSLREVGRKMSSLRESVILRKTLKDIKKQNPAVFIRLEENEKLSQILKRTDIVEIPSEQSGLHTEQVKEILNKSGFRIRFEPMTSLDPQLLLKELEMTYNRVVNNYLVCRNNPKPSTLHEFRKSSKDLLYQLWFFRPLNPATIKAIEKRLNAITQNLGRYNNLAQLIKGIGYKYEYTANQPALDELVILIRKEQDRYLARVWPAAHKLFCPGQKLVNLLGFKILIS
jgi:CHAD domain-containing protein